MQTKVKFLGHAAIWVETGDFRLLLDPFISGTQNAPVTVDELEPDYILVTHGHGDHMGDTVSIAKRCNATVITNAEIRNWLALQNVKSHGMNIGGGYSFPFGYLKMTLALHSSTLDDGTSGGNPGGFLLTTLNNRKLYFAGDTGLFGDMALIGETGLDLAMIPIGDNYTMGPGDALRAVKLLRPKVVVPIHYNTFGVIGQEVEPWKKMVEAETNARVVLLDPGGEIVID